MIIRITIIAIPVPKTYVSVIDAGGPAVGTTVGCGSSTVKVVSVDDGQFPLVPWKVAMTLKSPVMSGVHVRLYLPVLSVFVVPIFL